MKREFQVADANQVTIVHASWFADQTAIQKCSIAAFEIFEQKIFAENVDASMLTADRTGVERQFTLRDDAP